MKSSKRILDSVHGYIELPALFMDKIVDTIYFQRLRRIEQTSTRALFPSARHDRFIHSLGVYHLGAKIIESLRKRRYMDAGGALCNQSSFINSYLLACLLHDVAHSPFSHTFEGYYEDNKVGLDTPLINLVDNETFTADYKTYSSRTAPHEKMSAFVAYKVFKPLFQGKYEEYDLEEYDLNDYADWELIVRMICGIYYKSEGDKYEIANCLIDLIHGDVIDADGLDYVCRDAWAAGYQTSNVDVDRLIDAIEICKDKKGHYKLAFTSKALNEIEAVLSVKNFQQYHVINHHTVTYEQHLLVEAVKASAKHDFPQYLDTPAPIAQLCDLASYTDEVKSPRTEFSIKYPMDDDFIYLMKSHMKEPYVMEWFSREYRLIPVWKSRAEFYDMFPGLRGCRLTSKHWIFSDRCKQFLEKKAALKAEEIWLLKASPKYKGSFAEKVYIKVKDFPVKYVDLFPGDKNSFKPAQNDFYYLYVSKKADMERIKDLLKKEVELYIVRE